MCICPVAAGVVGVSSSGACALCAGKKPGDGTVLVVLDGVTVLPTKGTSGCLGAQKRPWVLSWDFVPRDPEGAWPQEHHSCFQGQSSSQQLPSSLAGGFPPASVARRGPWAVELGSAEGGRLLRLAGRDLSSLASLLREMGSRASPWCLNEMGACLPSPWCGVRVHSGLVVVVVRPGRCLEGPREDERKEARSTLLPCVFPLLCTPALPVQQICEWSPAMALTWDHGEKCRAWLREGGASPLSWPWPYPLSGWALGSHAPLQLQEQA